MGVDSGRGWGRRRDKGGGVEIIREKKREKGRG